MPPHEIDPRVLGHRIAEARRSRGKTQEEVAGFLGQSPHVHCHRKRGAYRQGRRNHQAGVILRGPWRQTIDGRSKSHRKLGCRSSLAQNG